MTQFEKMVRGELYSGDDALNARWFAAKDLAFRYNQLLPSDRDGREEILQKLLGKKGKNTLILSPFDVDYGENISVGDNFFANVGLVILDVCPVTIGSNVVIGAGSVVTKDIPDNVVAAGNPAKVIRPVTEYDRVYWNGMLEQHRTLSEDHKEEKENEV